MSNVKSIIQDMSAETRAKAEAFARAKGLSLEEAVAAQLTVEISEGALRAVSGGRPVEKELKIGSLDREVERGR